MNHFIENNSMAFGTFIMLCNHHFKKKDFIYLFLERGEEEEREGEKH